MKRFLIFLAAAIFLPNTVFAAPAQIYISQVQITGGKNNSQEDFVELFNPNTASVDLKGYRLVSRPADGTADSSIKVWTKSAIIPAKSFYLWANSGFTTIAVKPDVTSAAQISADSGVALRFGAANTGALVASAAWGDTNNGFINVSPANPGPGLSLQRKSLDSATSGFAIGPANPHNSAMTDLTAAFGSTNQAAAANQSIHSALPALPGQVAGAATGTVAVANPASAGEGDNPDQISNSAPSPMFEATASAAPVQNTPNPTKYLIIAVVAFVALLFVIGL